MSNLIYFVLIPISNERNKTFWKLIKWKLVDKNKTNGIKLNSEMFAKTFTDPFKLFRVDDDSFTIST